MAPAVNPPCASRPERSLLLGLRRPLGGVGLLTLNRYRHQR